MSHPAATTRAARLTTSERGRLAAEIFGSYAVIRWRLLSTGFVATMASAREERLPAHGSAELGLADAQRLAHRVQRALGTLPFDSRCLIRSLVLTRLLSRRGVHAPLVIGVSERRDFVAHAWVELDGVPLLPSGTGFQRLTEF